MTAILIWVSIIGSEFLLIFLLYVSGFFNKDIEIVYKNKQNTSNKYKLTFSKEDFNELIFGENKNDFTYETLPKNMGYSPRLFIFGRGSWRLTQGNIYTFTMLEKEMRDEFNQQL